MILKKATWIHLMVRNLDIIHKILGSILVCSVVIIKKEVFYVTLSHTHTHTHTHIEETLIPKCSKGANTINWSIKNI
jgi:hypothetical protein